MISSFACELSKLHAICQRVKSFECRLAACCDSDDSLEILWRVLLIMQLLKK